MVSFNRVVLAGNLTRDPELRFTRDRTPFSVPLTMRVFVRILAPLSNQGPGTSELRWSQTPWGLDTPTLRAVCGGCSSHGNLLPVPLPPSNWQTPPYSRARLACGL